jgi:hypothetical protein
VATCLGSQRAVERLILVTPYSSIADIAAARVSLDSSAKKHEKSGFVIMRLMNFSVMLESLGMPHSNTQLT